MERGGEIERKWREGERWGERRGSNGGEEGERGGGGRRWREEGER